MKGIRMQEGDRQGLRVLAVFCGRIQPYGAGTAGMKPQACTGLGSVFEGGGQLYIYPDNLKARATLWLWQLKDIGIIGVCALVSILALTQAGFFPPIVFTAVYAFLTIRFEDTSILDFIRYACAFFFVRQQFFEWRYTR